MSRRMTEGPLAETVIVLACLGAKQLRYAPAIVQSNLIQGVDMTRTIIGGYLQLEQYLSLFTCNPHAIRTIWEIVGLTP